MLIDTLPPDAAYAALQAHDARFDGRLYVGVTSTGIYCRPVCRVRLPRRENCRFFATAAQAEAERFRPCMKCRPELAPRALPWTTMDASRTLAQQAAAWLDSCDDADASVEDLARHLGITSRHLRRIFQAEHGVSPLQYLQTRRLLLAKALLTDSTLAVQEVAFAAGFASLRRFNAAFLEHYRLQPTALRREGSTAPPASRLRLGYREPYDAAGVLDFLAPRAVAGVERVEQGAITRTVALVHAGRRHAGWLRVDFDKPGEAGVSLSPELWPAVGSLLPLVRRWLDLDADPAAITAALGDGAVPGQRLPGCLDRFELAVRAVLGQQVTVAAARTLAGRFVERFGEPLAEAPEGCGRLFPTPERIAAATRDEIASLGIIGRRADSLVALAQAWPQLSFARREGPPEAAAEALTQIPGIGPWTASYMLMRGWSWPDAFPPGDVVLRKALGAGGPLSPKAYLEAAERYRPFRSYAVLHLWRHA
ncbi:Ada metal-binding domain-containing protein [Roseateles cellulosilyticus]|uniref:DNA-3-methyladenine glycosylase II n=1 Tax=Pelomonas cellulosilytica TaxID=2906762 RepID=A0ABS8XX60_9BURK|nr:Ada metal-binding domain-containing protein [Pelomonas sp. P8]MCE4555880.1 helix-turn-helix domain-containing protein [Pelomonas sp. P8]